MKVLPFQVRKADNWMYLVVDDASNEAAVVDVWDPEQMGDRIKGKGVKVGLGESKGCEVDQPADDR